MIASRFALACVLCLYLSLCLAKQANAASKPVSQTSGVRIQIFALASDPPGVVREAPGGGRVLTPAILFTPALGENIRGPAIVIVGAGPGSNPALASDATRWAATRLVAKGYTVLSIQSHMDRGFPLFEFKETAFEIAAALSALEARGYEDFILAGQSYGAIAAAHYVATTPDASLDKAGERRVKAVVLIDPLTEVRHYPGIELSKDYEAMMEKAKAAFATGRNSFPPGATLEVARGIAGDSWLGSGNFVAPAEAFLDYWGPEAVKRNEQALRTMPVPALIIAREKNPTVSVAKLKAVKADVRKDSPVDLITYPDVDADGRNTRLFDRTTADIFKWLVEHGVGPRSRIVEQFVDATTVKGRVLPGILYLPEKIDPRKPALLMTHGRSGDIIQSSTHWMGWRLAQKGYVVLAPSLRISGVTGIETSTRAEVTEDIAAWMTTMDSLGYKKVIATGHSNGGIWISDYKAITQDPRIVGMVYMAPTANVKTWEERKADPKIVAEYEEAKSAVEKGQGTAKVFGLQSAILVYDSHRPEALSHPERMAQFSIPGLAIVGAHDYLFSAPMVLDRMRAAYRGKFDLIRYANGTHGLRESKDILATDIDAWIKKTFPN